jgi:uncharacterized repeat protein (TIGR01451 family)
MNTRTTTRRNFLISQRDLFRIGIFVAILGLAMFPLLNVSSAASRNLFSLNPFFMQASESVATYDNCTTAKSNFTVGDTVCATVANISPFSKAIYWINPDGRVAFTDAVSSNNPSASRTISEAGNWSVYVVDSDGALRRKASFSVSNPAQPEVDLSVIKFIANGSSSVAAGATVQYRIIVRNSGPDAATAVTLTDLGPNDASFQSAQQDSGPTFTCAGTACTIASMDAGETAVFSFNYLVNSGAANGTVISNTATVASTTPESHAADNTWTAETTVQGTAGGGETCTISCPEDINRQSDTTQSGQPGAVVHFATPSGNTECGTITVNHCNDCFFPVGTTVVTATAASGDTCSFSVTITDANDTGPTIQCPTNKSVTADPGSCTATVDPGTPTTTGTGVSVSGQRSDGAALDDPYPSGVTTITWTATDDQERSVTCTQTITVDTDDTTSPTVTAPDDVTVNTGDEAQSCGIIVGETELGSATASDNCTSVTVARTGVPAGNFFPVGTTTVTYTATDGQGNTASDTQTVTVVDNSLPTITATAANPNPPPATVDVPIANVTVHTGPNATGCAVTVSDAELGNVQARDNCPNPQLTRSPTGNSFQVGITVITWTATDASGNTSTAAQTVTVIDDTQPTITAPADATYQCASDVPTADPASATAADNCPNPIVTVTESNNGGAGSTSSPLVISRVFKVTDASGNTASATQTITVRDNTPPTITAPPDATYQCANAVPDADPAQATASDNCSTPTVTVSQTSNGGNGSPSSPLVITRTYTATDSFGNSASDSQTITVVDNTPPAIVLNGPNPQVVECHTAYVEYGATATDNCSGNVDATASGTVNTNVVGSYTITYSASDSAGNALTPVTRTVNVVDTIDPVITLNGASSVTVECHTSFTDPGATAADSCDSSVPVTVSGSVNVNVSGTYTLIYNAVDDSGNHAAAKTRIVNVVDTTLPTITVSSTPVSMWPPNHKFETFAVSSLVTAVSDSCNTNLGVGNVVISKVTSDEVSGETDIIISPDCRSVQLRRERNGNGNGRVYTITFRLRDAAGNTRYATKTISVPHSNNGTSAVDSGPQVTVNGTCP